MAMARAFEWESGGDGVKQWPITHGYQKQKQLINRGILRLQININDL